ncbi:MAG: glycosyltransferase family 2 protein [Bacteroidales bacterium]|nr:glycosyltransferase family 2 protein [Bacteroidales bacterium]
MNLSPKVTISIAVYNVSATLRRCLNSVINQTLKEIEIVLVNDCSPDPEDDDICKDYEQSDDRVVYIKHKQNLGLGGARNTAIKAAKSDYILFVDSDDWISLDMADIMYNKATKNNADVVVCGFFNVSDKKKPRKNYYFKKEHLLKGKDGFKSFFAYDKKEFINPASWNKLWKRSLFIDNNLFFPLNIYDQDFAHTPQMLFCAQRVLLIKECLYYYYHNPESVTKNITEKHIHDPSKALEILRSFLIEQNALEDYYLEYWKGFFLGRVYAHYSRILIRSKDTNERNKLLVKTTQKLLEELEPNEIFQIIDTKDILLFINCIREIVFKPKNRKWFRWYMLPWKGKMWMAAVEITKSLGLYKLLRPIGIVLKPILRKI